MNNLITIHNVSGYLDENGVAHLNLKNVAKGLGFVRIANSGNEVVRWETVRRYLSEFGVVPTRWHEANPQQVGEEGLPDFIPENIFYKLCFKAQNETARMFQDIVTDEIIPSIRKHGAYMTPSKIEEVLLNPDTIIRLATDLKAEQEKRRNLETKIEEDAPLVFFANSISVSKTSTLIGEVAKNLKRNGYDTGEKRFFETLRQDGFLIKRQGKDRNMPTQYSMERGLFEVGQTSIIRSDGSPDIKKTTYVTGKGQIYFMNRYAGVQIVKEENADDITIRN